MADMPTSFWSGWIAVITLVSLTGLVWLLFSIYFSAEEQDSKHGDVVWDETLNEGEVQHHVLAGPAVFAAKAGDVG